MKHVVLRNPRLIGWEYGMLRAFEDEIVRQTGAEIVDVPFYGDSAILKWAGHGMRLEAARKYLPKKSFKVEADVIWYILMGPENYELDMFSDWAAQAKHRIVYLYDTLEPQFPLMKKLFSDDLFNVRITSFDDAVPHLEELTGKQWHAIDQAVPAGLFKPVPADEKLIHFSSYGRRFPIFHEALLEFCRTNGLYFDYTMHAFNNPTAPEPELYRQYAWHLTHSRFTVSWPVELTNPKRAGRLHPITCRWFEAAASATIVLGKKPSNSSFEKRLSPGLVTELDPFAEKRIILKQLDRIYNNFDALQQNADQIAAANMERFTWKHRVFEMLDLLK